MRVSRKRRFAWRRVISAGLSLCLLITSGGPVQAAPAEGPAFSSPAFPSKVSEIKIPANIGTVQEAYQGGERLVILVQDAHSIPSAQRNIRNLIDYFQQTHGLSTVAVEGARGRLDAQVFRSFPEREKMKAVFSRYLEAGELTGTTFAAVFNAREADYRDVEDWDLFEEGYGYYLTALENSAEIRGILERVSADLAREKENLYAPELLKIDRALRDFRNHSAGLLDVLRLLAPVKAPPAGGEIALLLEESSHPESSAIPLEMEVKAIAEKVKRYFQMHPSSGGGARVFEFNEKMQSFQTSRLSAEAFAVYLKDLAREMGFPVKFSGDFHQRVQRQMKIDDIDGTRFFDAFERYAASVKDELLRSEAERRADLRSERLYLLERLAALELTREQWQQMKSYARRGQFSGPNHIFLNETDLEQLMPEPQLRRLLEPHLLFYENAEKRDGVLAANLEKILSESSEAQKTVMMVAGGFHTEGLVRELRAKGMSYLLLMPKIESLPSENHYKDHMKGLVSWRDYFEWQDGEVSVYNAFVRAARDRLMDGSGGNSVLLKEWRDQILRDLSAKGRIAEASRYTRFIDEASAAGKGKTPEAGVLQKVDAFVAGLRELESRGQLDQAGVLRLLRPSSAAPIIPTNALVREPVRPAGTVRAGAPAIRAASLAAAGDAREIRSELRSDEAPASPPASKTPETVFEEQTVQEVFQANRNNWLSFRILPFLGIVIGLPLLVPSMGLAIALMLAVMVPVHELGHFVFAKYFFEKRHGKVSGDPEIEKSRPRILPVLRWVRGIIPQPAVLFEEKEYGRYEQAVIAAAGFGFELLLGAAVLSVLFFMQPAGWFAAFINAVFMLTVFVLPARVIGESPLLTRNGDTAKFFRALRGQSQSLDSPSAVSVPPVQPEETSGAENPQDPRSELRADTAQGRIPAAVDALVNPFIDRAQKARAAGQDDSYVMFSDIRRALILAQAQHEELREYSPNHNDFTYDYAEYLYSVRGVRLDPDLILDLKVLNEIISSVLSGSESKALDLLRDASARHEYGLRDAAVHRLAARLETAGSAEAAKIAAFLSGYVKTGLQEYGPYALGFSRYLIDEHLEKGHTLVFLGRGTEQMQQILEGALGDRLEAYRPRILEVLISTELLQSLPPPEQSSYLRASGVSFDRKTVFIDTGFSATIAEPLAKTVNTEGGDAEFCLYCYVKPTPGILRRFKALLGYFFPAGETPGLGYNQINDLFRSNEQAFVSTAHFFDDMLGKRVEKVWKIDRNKPVLTPTRTPKFYEISRGAVEAWIRANVRSELRADSDTPVQESASGESVYGELVAWRTSSILSHGLLRPSTVREKIASGGIVVSASLNEALRPFGQDAASFLFTSSADAKTAPEVYESQDKGALVVIQDIKSPQEFLKDDMGYESYEEYLRSYVRILTEGMPEKSPVSVIAERDFVGLEKELNARGPEILEQRLRNSAMILLSTSQDIEALKDQSVYADAANILGFESIPAEQIEAVFVPAEIYQAIAPRLAPEALKKIISVNGETELIEMDPSAPEGLKAPSWGKTIADYLKDRAWGEDAQKNFMLHGTRFDTPDEIRERLGLPRSELRTDSHESVQESAPRVDRSELRTDSTEPETRFVKLDENSQILPVLAALENHPEENQRLSSDELDRIWKFLLERFYVQENLYGISSDLPAVAGLFLRPGPGEARLIEGRYPGILDEQSDGVVKLAGPVVKVGQLGFGQSRFAYTVLVEQGTETDQFYAKVDNREIGKKRDSFNNSATYLEMKNQELLEQKFSQVPHEDRPYAQQFMTVRVDLKDIRDGPEGAAKSVSRWVQYGRLAEGLDLEKAVRALTPGKSSDAAKLRFYSFALGEMAGRLFYQTVDDKNEGWFFGDMKAANVGLTGSERPRILDIDSELLLLPEDQRDPLTMPGTRKHNRFEAQHELAQIPYKVILEPLEQIGGFIVPAAAAPADGLSESQVANLFLAGFLSPLRGQADWAARAEAATGLALDAQQQAAVQEIWREAARVDAGEIRDLEGLDAERIEHGGTWMRERLNTFLNGGRSELRTVAQESIRDLEDPSSVIDAGQLSRLADAAGENLIRFFRRSDPGADLELARLIERGVEVDFESFIDAMVKSVESRLGSETQRYQQTILAAMADIAARLKTADYKDKKGVFVLSPKAERAELDRAQANAYRDALLQASGFIGSLYYRFRDNPVLREAVKEAGIQHFQPVSTLSSIRVPEDLPALPLLTAGTEGQETRGRIPFMQIGLIYPEDFSQRDASAMEETFAVFMQFVFGYVAQNKLSREQFEFLNRLQELAREGDSAEAVLNRYDQQTAAAEGLRARERIAEIRAALIRPLTEILGEGAPGLLSGLELGRPGIVIGEIADAMKAYEAVRKSA